MAHDVFISYSKKDKAVADAICARLEQDGVRCWYAPRDIVPGADWAASIIEAIEKTKVMVLVFTDFANASRQVLREINNAVRCGVIIVPFRMTRAEPSKGMRYYLSTVHWLDAMDAPLENSIHQLSRKVTSVLCGTDLDSGDRIPTEPAAAASPAAGAKSLPTAAEPAAAASSGETPAGAPEKGESGNKDKIRKLLYALAALAIVGIGIVIGSRMGDRGQTEIPASAEPAAVTAVPAEAAEQQAPPAQAEAPAVGRRGNGGADSADRGGPGGRRRRRSGGQLPVCGLRARRQAAKVLRRGAGDRPCPRHRRGQTGHDDRRKVL